jgi:hypothetical protein
MILAVAIPAKDATEAWPQLSALPQAASAQSVPSVLRSRWRVGIWSRPAPRRPLNKVVLGLAVGRGAAAGCGVRSVRGGWIRAVSDPVPGSVVGAWARFQAGSGARIQVPAV